MVSPQIDLHLIEDALVRFDQYCVLQNRAFGDRYNHLGTEAAKRIVQVKKLIQKIMNLENEGLALAKQTNPPWFDTPQSRPGIDDMPNRPEFRAWSEFSKTEEWRSLVIRQGDIGDEIQLYAECFYWIAFRARSVIRLMPGLHRFEATGVRNIRNKLLEHPEKGDSGVLLDSFGWGAKRGPVIKALRFDHQRDIWPDAGLYVNAEEFFKNLYEATGKAIEDPSSIKA